MGNYALVQNGKVINTVVWDGEDEVDFGEGVVVVEMPDGVAAGISWSYEDEKFEAPEPTAEDVEAKNELSKQANIAMKDSLMTESSEKISVLQDAIGLKMATDDETAALPLWKKYRVLLSRIDAETSDDITWPERPA